MSDVVDKTQEGEERIWQQWENVAFANPQAFAQAMNIARFCQDCGELIPPKRVQAVPHCTRCTDCQELAERC